MVKYTLALLFSTDLQSVWLMEKQKPEWQNGFLNGIGGKMVDGETPLQCAIRELREESGVSLKEQDLTAIGEINGANDGGEEYTVFVFAGTTNMTLKAQETESIHLLRVDEVKSHKVITNVPMIIETCIYRLSHQKSSGRLVMK